MIRHILVVLVFLLSCVRVNAVSYQTLDILQPVSGLDTANRFYKAYPGLEYSVYVAVEGGAYPYTYSLTTAPSGMAIDADSGEITWSSPTTTGSPHSITALVTDNDGNTDSVSWTLTVTTTGFVFVSPDGTGDGSSHSSPISFTEWYEGSVAHGTQETRGDDTYSGYFTYFLGGTYNPSTDGLYSEAPGRLAFSDNDKSMVWLAYPGETPIIDCDGYYLVFYNDTTPLYVGGLSFDIGDNNYVTALRITSSLSHVTIVDNNFYGQGTPTSSTNLAVIFIERSGAGINWSISNNTFTNNPRIGIEGYQADHVLIEANTFVNQGSVGGSAIYPKMSTMYWTIRGNYLSNSGSRSAIDLDAYTDYGAAGPYEVCYNTVNNASGAALYVNYNYDSDNFIEESWIYRNTFDGDVTFRAINDTDDGPFLLSDNIIINTADDYSCNSCSLPSQITDTDNLKGSDSDNIIDSSGLLIGTYRDTYLGSVGAEISGTTHTWYEDADGDGYHASNTQTAETGPGADWYLLSELTGGGDCNDSVAGINPGATDICGNGIAEDCVADVACPVTGTITIYSMLDGKVPPYKYVAE